MPAIGRWTMSSAGGCAQIAFSTEEQLGRDYLRWYGEADPVTQQFLLQFLAIQRKSVGEFGDLLARIGIVKGIMRGFCKSTRNSGILMSNCTYRFTGRTARKSPSLAWRP